MPRLVVERGAASLYKLYVRLDRRELLRYLGSSDCRFLAEPSAFSVCGEGGRVGVHLIHYVGHV